MKTRDYEIEVVTPLFLSGADQTNVELRAPSIKGQLRWWWRAMHGHLTLSELKKKEEEIFGSTSKRSSFSLIVDSAHIKMSKDNLPPGKKEMVTSRGKTFPMSIIDYLAYGIAEFQKGKGNVYKRPHIRPKSIFNMKCVFYNENIITEIEKTILYWIYFGGLGAKSRNGFGSLTLVKNGGEIKPDFKQNKGNFTSFSRDSRIFYFNKYSQWVDALVEIGRIYRKARLNLEPLHIYERRPFVAKPLIIKNERVFIEDRHAKQFFLHIDKIKDKYQGKILVLPYNYKENTNQAKYDEVINDMCDFFIKSGAKLFI